VPVINQHEKPVALTFTPPQLTLGVLRRLPKAAMVIALASSIGLHWAFFQSLAWLGMVVTYSQEASFTEALVKTFDGSHPCALCKEIAKGKQSEKKSNVPVQWKKFEFSYARAVFVFGPSSRVWKLLVPESYGDLLPNQPPVPPPRFQFS